MAGSFRIIDAPDGTFSLEPTTRGAPIPPEIVGMVGVIEGELGRLRERAGSVGAEQLKQLRAIAEQGLTGEKPDPEMARALMRARFRSPLVYPDGLEDISVEVPSAASPAQLDFVFRFNASLRMVQKLHQPRQQGALSFWRWLRRTPGQLLTRLTTGVKPPPPPPSKPAPTEAFQKARLKLIRAARFALPDINEDRLDRRTPQIEVADRLVEVVVQEARLDLGPTVRRNHLTDLAAAYAGTALIFAAACFLLYLFWGFIHGWQAIQDNSGFPPYKHFSLAAVAVSFLFVGAWLSTAQRLNGSDKSAALESIFAENFDSWMRACVLLGVGVLIILMLNKQVVVINLGGADGQLSTKNVLDSFSAAVIVGALLGLSERVLPDVLTERSKGLADRLGASAPPPPPPQGQNTAPTGRNGPAAVTPAAVTPPAVTPPAVAPPVVPAAATAPVGPTPAAPATPEAAAPPRSKGKG